jgi:hypothetical protein
MRILVVGGAQGVEVQIVRPFLRGCDCGGALCYTLVKQTATERAVTQVDPSAFVWGPSRYAGSCPFGRVAPHAHAHQRGDRVSRYEHARESM